MTEYRWRPSHLTTEAPSRPAPEKQWWKPMLVYDRQYMRWYRETNGPWEQ